MFVHGPHQRWRDPAPGAGPIADRQAVMDLAGVHSDDLIRRLASTCPLPLADRWAPFTMTPMPNPSWVWRAKALRETAVTARSPSQGATMVNCSQVWLCADCLINCPLLKPQPGNCQRSPGDESAIPFKTDQRQIGYLRLRHRRDPMSPRQVGHIYLAFAMMTVGSTVIASRLIAGDLPPFVATALRFAIALPVMAGIALAARSVWPRLTRSEWVLLAVQAGAGSVGYTTLLIAGLAHMPAADAGIVIGTLPAVSALFAVAILGERPHPRLLLSVALATAGVLAVAWSGGGERSWLGVALVLAAVLCESAFILLNKRMAVPLAPLLQATAMTGLGLVISAPFALLDAGRADWTFPALAAVTWYALVPTVGGFLLWYAGAARVSGAEAATFTAIAPLTAVTGAALVLGEPVGPAQLAGMLTVIAAIALLSLPHRKSQVSP